MVKKFSYTHKFDIISPLKCGTRWLEKNTNPDSIEQIKFKELFNSNQTHKDKTFFIYRDILEHFKSGLYTEYLWFNHTPVSGSDSSLAILKLKENMFFFNNYKNINQLFKKQTAAAGHFIPNLWEEIHYNKPNFIFVKLDNLKNIFDDENISYNPTDYDFSKEYNDIPSKEEVFSMLSKNDLIYLNKIIEKETDYLNKVLSIK